MVVLDEDTGEALKIYIIDRLFPESKKELLRDQAYREFKALTLLGAHPNIIQLKAGGLQEVEEESVNGKTIQNSPCLFLEYVENLLGVRQAAFLWGFVPGASEDDTPTPDMNFEHRNTIVRHILGQGLGVLQVLEAHRIRHRDLDNTNLKITFPEMTLKIMDFARADVPDAEGMRHMQSPDSIIKDAEREIAAKNKDPIWKACVQAYHNPLNSCCTRDSLPPGIEYTDRMGMKFTLQYELKWYIEKGFRWGVGESKQAIIDENLVLLALFQSVWRMGGVEAEAALKVEGLDQALKFMREQTPLCMEIIKHLTHEANMGWGNDFTRDFFSKLDFTPNNVSADRSITHSSDYLSRGTPVDPVSL